MRVICDSGFAGEVDFGDGLRYFGHSETYLREEKIDV